MARLGQDRDTPRRDLRSFLWVMSIFDMRVSEKIELLLYFVSALSVSMDQFSVLYKSMGEMNG